MTHGRSSSFLRRLSQIACFCARATGRSSDLRALLACASLPTSRRFPVFRTSACDGGRSCLPLRDSPGFSPGSLLTLPPMGEGETVYEVPSTRDATSHARTIAMREPLRALATGRAHDDPVHARRSSLDGRRSAWLTCPRGFRTTSSTSASVGDVCTEVKREAGANPVRPPPL